VSFLFSTVVDSAYMPYVPIFAWTFRHIYQDCGLKLFMRDPCPYPAHGAEIVPMFEDFPRYQYNSIALRFVVPPEHYEGWEYVYVGDIDLPLMPEPMNLEQFHTQEMVASRLCYSNSLRHKSHYQGYQSLTGLHFATPKWFKETEDERVRYWDLLKRGLVGCYREYDGAMLYRMAERSGVGLPKKYKLKNRHHGIHLSNFNRLFKDNKKAWRDRVPQNMRSQWLMWLQNKEFADICARSRADSADLNTQLDILEDFCRHPEGD